MNNEELFLYDNDLDLIINCYINGDIKREQLETALLRAEITIIEFAKIITRKDILQLIKV